MRTSWFSPGRARRRTWHTLSVLARKSGLRVDRLYLTTGSELPPADADWRPSPRVLAAQEG